MCRTEYFKNSFFPNVITECNKLDIDIQSMTSCHYTAQGNGHVFFDLPGNFVALLFYLPYLPSHYMRHNWKSCPRGRRNWALTVLFVFCVFDVGD